MTDTLTHNGVPLAEHLRLHGIWLRGEAGGVRADLRGADLTYANLTDANLTDANLTRADLTRANLTRADLTYANLTYANLTDANLTRADLTRANLTDADLTDANLTRANLTRANLTRANLTRANLTRANLRGTGNMAEIKTLQIERWRIGYTADTLQIGCQRHPISKWRKWDTEAGRVWIAKMDDDAPEWAARLLPLILAIIDASPATPTGHEGAAQ